MQPKTALEWTRRLERAQRLRHGGSAAEQLLGFYEEVLKVQGAIAEDLAAREPRLVPGKSFAEQIDLEVPLRHLPELLDVTMRLGTKVLADSAQEFAETNVARRKLDELLRGENPLDGEGPDRFFLLALAQPAAEYLASTTQSDSESPNRCPVCGQLPLLAILRPEGDGAKRFLQCSFCLNDWAYRRVLCPWCGETDKEKLPRYTADECDYVRVEACDTCKHYLKSIDQTINGNTVPLVDEIALAALDIWALEHGFTKIASNLFGV